MEECNLLSVGLPFLKFRRFIPKVSPKFSCASAGAQLRTNGNSPKFRWNFRRGSFCHRSPFSVGQSLVVALICVESNIWAPTRGCPYGGLSQLRLRNIYYKNSLHSLPTNFSSTAFTCVQYAFTLFSFRLVAMRSISMS